MGGEKKVLQNEADRTHRNSELQAAAKGSNSQFLRLPYTTRSYNLKA